LLKYFSIFRRMNMASKREKVKLKSSESSFHYYTTKNKVSCPERITRKKFDPTVKKHVEFKETK
jgi:large subunit ribosomal protein L33